MIGYRNFARKRTGGKFLAQPSKFDFNNNFFLSLFIIYIYIVHNAHQHFLCLRVTLAWKFTCHMCQCHKFLIYTCITESLIKNHLSLQLMVYKLTTIIIILIIINNNTKLCMCMYKCIYVCVCLYVY